MREQLPFFRGQTDGWAPLAMFGTTSWSGSGLLPCSPMRLSAQARRARHEPPPNRACGSVSPDAKTMQKGKVAFQPPSWVGWGHDETTAMSPLSVYPNLDYPS